MKVRKRIERDGRSFLIVESAAGHMQIIDEASGTVLDAFELVETTDGWESSGGPAPADPAVAGWAASFAAEVKAGKITLD